MSWKDYRNWWEGEFTTAEFSPDGRYLAFVTIGQVTIDTSGWPVSVDMSDPNAVHLNILDLKTKQLLQSLPYGNPHMKAKWSPTSQYLIYIDSEENWNLVDLAQNTVLPIIHSGWEQPYWTSDLYLCDPYDSPSWSFEGHYLSFVVRRPTYGNFTWRDVTTYVFGISAALSSLP